MKMESSGTIHSTAFNSCGSNINSSCFFNNVVYACGKNYTGWTSYPTGQDVSSVNTRGLNIPENYEGIFTSTIKGLKPSGLQHVIELYLVDLPS